MHVSGRYKCLYVYKENLVFSHTGSQRVARDIDFLTSQKYPIFPNVQQVVDADIPASQQKTTGLKKGRPLRRSKRIRN